MRKFALLAFVPVLLAACGTTERTVYVEKPASKTVVVTPQSDEAVVVHRDRDVEVVR